MIAYSPVDTCSFKPYIQLSIKQREQRERPDCNRHLLIYRMKYVPQSLAGSKGEYITQYNFDKLTSAKWIKINIVQKQYRISSQPFPMKGVLTHKSRAVLLLEIYECSVLLFFFLSALLWANPLLPLTKLSSLTC